MGGADAGAVEEEEVDGGEGAEFYGVVEGRAFAWGGGFEVGGAFEEEGQGFEVGGFHGEDDACCNIIRQCVKKQMVQFKYAEIATKIPDTVGGRCKILVRVSTFLFPACTA